MMAPEVAMRGPEPLRVLIVDDEPLARERLRRLLSEEQDMDVIGLCADGAEAVAAIRRDRPDLVFLDIRMPDRSGFEIIGEIGPSEMPVTIFVTAYDSHAVSAFEAGAVDYLVKPFADERFARTLDRARNVVRLRQASGFEQRLAALIAAHRPPERLDRLVIKSGSKVTLLQVADIDWIGAAGPYAEIHAGDRTHVLRMSLTEMEARLDPRDFQRIHRSTIVNIERVRELQEYFRGEYHVLLKGGTRLKLSRGRRPALEARLGQSL